MSASPSSKVHLGVIPESEERFLDAQDIEEAAKHITRPTAMMQVAQLVERIRRDAKALQRAEKSKERAEKGAITKLPESAVALKPESAVQLAAVKDLSLKDDHLDDNTKENFQTTNVTVLSSPAITLKYVPIDRFAFDAGKYNSPTVTLYVTLPGVGALPKENVTCAFTSTSFDLIVSMDDDSQQQHRLFRDNLSHDIDPTKSKYIVKKDKVVVKLAKVKGEYGSYDSWTELSSKKKKKSAGSGKKDNPTESIMDLMKDMYDSGDDNMKKMIGETMLKQRNGELDKPSPPSMDNFDMDNL